MEKFFQTDVSHGLSRITLLRTELEDNQFYQKEIYSHNNRAIEKAMIIKIGHHRGGHSAEEAGSLYDDAY